MAHDLKKQLEPQTNADKIKNRQRSNRDDLNSGGQK